MDYLGLITGDNIFKYSFTLGVVMLVFALIYPLEKQHLIELEINSHNKETELLNGEISNLSQDLDKLRKESDLLLSQASALQSGQNVDKIEAKKKVDRFNFDFKILQDKKHNLEIKNIVLEYNKKRILVLESQARTFCVYSFFLILFGVSLAIFGFFHWARNTFREMKSNTTKKQVEKK